MMGVSKEIKDLKAQLEAALLELSKATGKSVNYWRNTVALEAQQSGIREQIEHKAKQNSLANLEVGRGLSDNPITFRGKTQSRQAWADEVGMPLSTLRSRLDRYHWTVEEALTTPVRYKATVAKVKKR